MRKTRIYRKPAPYDQRRQSAIIQQAYQRYLESGDVMAYAAALGIEPERAREILSKAATEVTQ